MSMSARVSIECLWLACTGNHLAGNRHDIGHGLAMFCDSLSVMEPPCGSFHLEKCRA